MTSKQLEIFIRTVVHYSRKNRTAKRIRRIARRVARNS